jgi:Zinc finger C-x8-C-x5-C-x3-H type (and similar)
MMMKLAPKCERLLINLCLCPDSVPSPDPCTFHQRNNCTYQVMCNFWKHQGFCPRGNSCTYAHGEADKRPQYSGDDVRRKNARPMHYEHTQQPAAEAVAMAAASDPAELMRQVAAASGRAAAGASCTEGPIVLWLEKLHETRYDQLACVPPCDIVDRLRSCVRLCMLRSSHAMLHLQAVGSSGRGPTDPTCHR